MPTSLVDSLNIDKATPGSDAPAQVSGAGLVDSSGFSQAARADFNGFAAQVKAIMSFSVVTFAQVNDTFQSGAFDMTGAVPSQLNGGFTAFGAVLLTDTATAAVLCIDCSQDGISWGRVASAGVALQSDGNYSAALETQWRGPRWYRVSGGVGAAAPTNLFTVTGGLKAL